MGQCKTCGRCDEDWASPESRVTSSDGTKTKQTKSTRDKSAAYREWRWKLGGPYYASDIDMIEWRIRDGKPTPVAILELTELKGMMPPPPRYLQNIIDRFTKRDGQASAAKRFAELLGADVYIVLFRWDLEEFWTYNLSRGGPWRHRNKAEYERAIKKL